MTQIDSIEIKGLKPEITVNGEKQTLEFDAVNQKSVLTLKSNFEFGENLPPYIVSEHVLSDESGYRFITRINDNNEKVFELYYFENSIEFPGTLIWNPNSAGGNEKIIKIVQLFLLPTTFSPITLPSSGNWRSITCSPITGRFVTAAYNSNKAAYSDDGITWTPTTLPSSDSWYSTTCSPITGRFVTVAYNSNKAVYSRLTIE